MPSVVMLGINHQSPLIYCAAASSADRPAGNQSPIPFDILAAQDGICQGSWESITNPL